MKLIILLAVVAAAVAAPQNDVEILRQVFDVDEQGNYQYAYELSDGQAADETGRVIRGPEPETGSIDVSGSYSFFGDDGNQYTVTYTANEGGFQPQAAHLPVAPAQIPEYAQLRQDYPELFWAEG